MIEDLTENQKLIFSKILITALPTIHTLCRQGVFRGEGHWAMAPPLGRQDSIISIK